MISFRIARWFTGHWRSPVRRFPVTRAAVTRRHADCVEQFVMELQFSKCVARRLAEIVILGLFGALAAAAASGEPDSDRIWRLAGSLSNRGEIPRVLAWAADANRIAFADDAGVSRLYSSRHGNRPDRAALEGVRDLAFDREDVLWIGTDSGLYRWEDGLRPKRRPLRGGGYPALGCQP